MPDDRFVFCEILIISDSTPHFPARTGEGFLELLKAIAASPPGTPSPTPVEQFLGREENSAALVSGCS